MTAHYLTHHAFALGPAIPCSCTRHPSASVAHRSGRPAARRDGHRHGRHRGKEPPSRGRRGRNEVIVYTQGSSRRSVASTPQPRRGRGLTTPDQQDDDQTRASAACVRAATWSFGFATDGPPSIRLAQLRGSLSSHAARFNQSIATRGTADARAHAVFDWISTGALKVRIDRVALRAAAAAHRALEARETAGKIVLSL